MNRSYISTAIGEIRGVPAAEPMLQVTVNIETNGLSDGTSALFLISASLQGEAGGPVIMGTAAPVLKQLGFSARVGGDRPYTDQIAAQWALSDVAIDRIEQSRNGGSVTFWPNIQYALISQGTTPPDWPQPQVPIRVPFPENPIAVRIEAHSGCKTFWNSGKSPPLSRLWCRFPLVRQLMITGRLSTA